MGGKSSDADGLNGAVLKTRGAAMGPGFDPGSARQALR